MGCLEQSFSENITLIQKLYWKLVYRWFTIENQEVTEPIKFTASNLIYGRYKFNLFDLVIILRDLGDRHLLQRSTLL